MRENKRERVWNQQFSFGDAEKDRIIQNMSRELGVSQIFSVLLYNRGYDSPEKAKSFLHYEKNDFHDPFLIADIEAAVDRIFCAIDNNERICIYGDYDVDGVTSVSVLYLYLKKLGADVGIKIPKRESEGYGVSCDAVSALSNDNVKLVITVDTGITANKEVEYARNLGIDFVVTDHHECHGELPSACAVVNPHRPDCQYPFKSLAGVGVIFKVICACEIVRCRKEGIPEYEGLKSICWELCDLVAIGTIADVMPLVDENRLIVSMGLKKIESECRPGLNALIESSYTRKSGDGSAQKKITSGMIGYGIAPKINAAGRISDAAIAVELLLATDQEKATRYSDILCEINKQRQLEENRIAHEAYEMIEGSTDFDNDKVIVLSNNEWQQGIIGIVASRITEKYGLPSILVTFSGDYDGNEESPYDDGKGSGRSIKGMNLVEALKDSEEFLQKYGGHELAAGLTVKRANLEDFRKRINEYAEKNLSEEALTVSIDADCEISTKELTLKFAEELQILEPFGVGNASPTFIIKNAYVKRISHIGGGRHSRLLLEKDGTVLTALYFGVGEGQLGFGEGETIDVLFNIDINEYKNVRSIQMIIQDIKLTAEYITQFNKHKKRFSEIYSGGKYLLSENVIPDREDCARVYKSLRYEYRNGTSVLDHKTILKFVNHGNLPLINYIKLKYILKIFNELNICNIEELDTDIYRFEVLFNSSKTNIEKSSILKKLRSQCDYQSKDNSK